MESQQPADSTQEPSFADLTDETLRLSQPSRRRNRDEYLRIDGEIQRVWYHDLGRDSRCLVILLEVGTIPDGVPNILFEGSYEGLNNDQITGWSSRPGMGHYRWLRGPINHLRREQRSEYVANTIRRIIDFLNI
uniref:Predicted protein n=1 Tax=Physcomitrium patens TaxID=3218 RepID=A9U4A2_PHYPA